MKQVRYTGLITQKKYIWKCDFLQLKFYLNAELTVLVTIIRNSSAIIKFSNMKLRRKYHNMVNKNQFEELFLK